MNERRLGLFCALGVVAAWSGFILMSRSGMRGALTPWDLALLRYAGAAIAILPVLVWRGWPRLPPLRAAALIATASLGFPLFGYAGFQFAPASHGAVMLPGMLPILTALLAWAWLGEAWTRARMVSLGLIACGVALLGWDTWGDHPGAWRGDLLLLAGSSCWAVFTLLARHWRVPALDAVMVVAAVTLPLYAPVWFLALPSNLSAAGWQEIAAQMLYQGGIAVVVALFLYTRALDALGAAMLTTITAIVPAVAAVMAWPLLGEPLGVTGFAGVLLVTVAIAWGVIAARPR